MTDSPLPSEMDFCVVSEYFIIVNDVARGLPWWSSGRTLHFYCGAQFGPLVRELRSQKPYSQNRKKKKMLS